MANVITSDPSADNIGSARRRHLTPPSFFELVRSLGDPHLKQQ